MGNKQCFSQYFPCHSDSKSDVENPTSLSKPTYIPQAVIDNKPPCEVPDMQMKTMLHRNIGVVTSMHPIKKFIFQGTGFLIADNLVLTCAHNLCNPLHGKKMHQSVKFYPGVHGKLAKYYVGKQYFIPDSYQTCKNGQLQLYDYALILLEQSVTETQFMPIGQNFQDFKIFFPISIYGYPSTQKFKMYKNQNETTECYMWQAGLTQSQKLIDDEQSLALKRVLYQISTQGGQSGAPVIVNKEGSQIIIAIHQGGYEFEVKDKQTSTITKFKCNIGRRITSDMIQQLIAWKEQCKGSHFDYFDYKTYSKSLIRRFSVRRTYEEKPIRQPQEIAQIESPSHSKYWELRTPFTKHFFIQGLEVTRLYRNNNNFYQVVSSNPISSSITRFKLQSYGGKNSIIFGIVGHQQKFSPWSKGLSIHSIGFVSYPQLKVGAIFSEKIKVKQWSKQLFIKEGQSLTMEVNNQMKRISFCIDSRLVRHQFQYGSNLNGSIFAFTAMKNKDSAIKVITQDI